MNDNNYMDNFNNTGCRNVQLATKTNEIGQTDAVGRCVSATNSLTVADTLAKRLKILFWCLLTALTVLVLMFCGKVNSYASELNVYVDDTYMSENFGSYPYYLIVTDENGNYMTIYSSAQICYNGSVFRAFCTNHYYGYKAMKVVDDYLVIDENGTSYDKWSSISVSFNSSGLSNSFKTIIYASKDIYNIGTSNTGSPVVGSSVVYSVVNNIGSKPVDEPTEPTPTPDIIVDCGFTDENILERLDTIETNTMEKLETINTTMVVKMDILITLILVMIAIRMFSPLANNHKRGLEKRKDK